MKRSFAICLIISILFSFPMPGKAGTPNDRNPKYATVIVSFQYAKGKIIAIYDGKTEITDCEKSEDAAFAAGQVELEKLGEMGYILEATSSMGAQVFVYSLLKQ